MKIARLTLPLAVCLLLLALVANASAAPDKARVHGGSQATDATVTTTADSGPGSLRAAIAGVKAGEEILVAFAPDVRGQITLASPLRVAAGTVSIAGPGAGALKLSGNGASRHFIVGVEGVLRVSGLTLTRGKDVGESSAGKDPGGAGEAGSILNRGLTALTAVTLTANEAIGGSSFRSHGGDAFGGAIVNRGELFLTRSLLSGNSARGSDEHDKAYVSRDLTGGAAAGGAVYNQGKMFVFETEFTSNSARGGDGVTIIPVFATIGTAGGDALGGAIFNGFQALGLTIHESTFAFDKAIGGSVGQGQLKDSPAGDAAGGGIFSRADGFSLLRSTVVRETAALGSPQGEKPAVLGAGGLELRGGKAVIRSSTIAFDSGSADLRTSIAVPTQNTIVGSCAGAATSSLGFNLDYRDSCGFTAATDLRNTDPGLAALADNGGPTRTLALGSESRAVDAGYAFEDLDQRGQKRPVLVGNRSLPAGGNGADIGAFELQRLPELRYELSPELVAFGPVGVGTVSKFQEVTLLNSGDVRIAIGAVTLGGRDQDEFSISSQTCAGADLGGGESCRVRIRFSPEETGMRQAVVTLSANPGGSIVVPLRGTGTGAVARR